jgi:hypothetical protein
LIELPVTKTNGSKKIHAALTSMGRACDSLEYSNSHRLQEFGGVFLESDAENYTKFVDKGGVVSWEPHSYLFKAEKECSDRLLEGFRQASVGL